MMVGSVRGKQRFDMPFRVKQSGRDVGVSGVVLPIEAGAEAKSAGGQVRLKPPFMESVVCPQPAQKGLRAFQSMSARASAYIAAWGAGSVMWVRP